MIPIPAQMRDIATRIEHVLPNDAAALRSLAVLVHRQDVTLNELVDEAMADEKIAYLEAHSIMDDFMSRRAVHGGRNG